MVSVAKIMLQNILLTNLHTSVGPAYIIGEGNMASTVLSGSSTPSSSTA